MSNLSITTVNSGTTYDVKPKVELEAFEIKQSSGNDTGDNFIAFIDPALEALLEKAEKDAPPPKPNQSQPQTSKDDLTEYILRSTSRAGIIQDAMGKFELRSLNNDGSYSRNGDPTRFFWQPGGYIFRAKDDKTKPATFFNGKWDESVSNPMPWTLDIAKLDLIPLYERATVFRRDNSSGLYYLQEDGSIWYEGGTENGVQSEPKTYVNGVPDTSKKTPLETTLLIDKVKLVPHPTLGFVDPRYAGVKCYPLTCGTLVYIGPSKEKGETRVWIGKPEGTPQLHPLSKLMIQNGYTPNPDGTWKGTKYPGKYYLQMDGSMIYQGKSSEGNQKIWICTKQGEWKQYSVPCSETLSGASLEVDADGHIKLPSYHGKFLIREDGSEVYIGKNDSGKTLVWIDPSGTEKKRMNSHPASEAIVNLNLTPNSNDDSWSSKDYPGKFYPQDDGSLLYINGNEKLRYRNGAFYAEEPPKVEEPKKKQPWWAGMLILAA